MPYSTLNQKFSSMIYRLFGLRPNIQLKTTKYVIKHVSLF